MTRDELINSTATGAPSQAKTEPVAAISIGGLLKSFGSQVLLAGVSPDIAEGEMLVVLGPSSSGKTTLLRIIAGLEQCDSGDIYLKGRCSTLSATSRCLRFAGDCSRASR